MCHSESREIVQAQPHLVILRVCEFFGDVGLSS